MEKSIVILTGGGPAPGMNTVVGSIAKTFLQNGYRVLGLNGGYKGLFSPNPNYCQIDFLLADWIFNRGGSYLMMSRFKPSQEDFDKHFNLDFFKDNNIQLLVTVGGDDTASTANRIAKFLKERNYHIANIHVPKTRDKIVLDIGSIEKLRKECKEIKQTKCPYAEVCLGAASLLLGAFLSALISQMAYELKFLSILFYSICPVGGIGCSVAYYFLRKNSMADAKKLADYVEEYIIVPAEESEE